MKAWKLMRFYPATPVGKPLAGVVAFIGIGVIAIPTGIVAGAFANAMTRRQAGGAAQEAREGEGDG